MPTRDEITEEGFGFFRGTWFVGRVPVREALDAVEYERRVLEALDGAASLPEEYEQLAVAAEDGDGTEVLSNHPLGQRFVASGLAEMTCWEGDMDPLGSLEIGVAGLVYSLAAIRCVTAASCRWHIAERSCRIVQSSFSLLRTGDWNSWQT